MTDPLGPARALLLDIDDTVLDTKAAMTRAAALLIGEIWPEAAERREELGARYHADPGGFFARYTSGELAFARMRELRLQETAEHAGLSWSREHSDAFEAAWPGAFSTGTEVFDDVRPLLERCAARGIRVGALTNSSTTFTELKLRATGLADAFAAVATTDTLGFGKPDPRAFHEACRLLGSDRAETAYVGDALEVDAVAANAAGLRGIWLDRRGRREAEAEAENAERLDAEVLAVPVIHSLDELVLG